MPVAFELRLGAKLAELTVPPRGPRDAASSLRTLSAAASAEPGDPDFDYILGCALLRSGRAREALDRCRAAVMLEPRNPEYHVALAGALWQLGRLDDAEAALADAEALQPDDPEVLAARAAALVALRRPSAAVPVLERSRRLAPGRADAHANLGAALFAVGRAPDGLASFREALRLEPGAPDLERNLALALLAANESQEALALLRQATAHRPTCAATLLDLAEAAHAAGRMEEAAAALAEASRLEPTAIAARPRTLAVRDAIALERIRAGERDDAPADAGGQTADATARLLTGALSAAVDGLQALLSRRRQIVRWMAMGGCAIGLAALARAVPPHVEAFLLRDDLAAVARAATRDGAVVRDRLAHAVAARGLRDRLDPSQCEVTTDASWRRIRCGYAAEVALLPGWKRTFVFRIDVEQPFALRED